MSTQQEDGEDGLTSDFTDEEWLWAMKEFAPDTPAAEVRRAVVARRAEAGE
jgi:hypothetical protein